MVKPFYIIAISKINIIITIVITPVYHDNRNITSAMVRMCKFQHA